MAVVAIVSILAVVAIAAYSDYAVRSKVDEAMGFAVEAKTKVSQYYYNNKEMPQNNAEAGLRAPEEYEKFEYMRRLELSRSEPFGVITITFKLPGTKADNKLLQLIPSTTDGVIYWRCTPPSVNGIADNQLPPNCRG